jgi:ADP-ribose pyrophosphatase
MASALPALHVKARSLEYLGGIKRFPVPDDKVPWSVPWEDYQPVDYTAPVVLKGPVWADPDIKLNNINTYNFMYITMLMCIIRGGIMPSKPVKFNEMDGNINRVSHTGRYELDNGVPRNPVGRTGMCGRGLLGKWGPNHAADPVVTRQVT